MSYLKLTDSFDNLDHPKFILGHSQLTYISSIDYHIHTDEYPHIVLTFHGASYIPKWGTQEEVEQTDFYWDYSAQVDLRSYLKEITQKSMDCILKMQFSRQCETADFYIDKYFEEAVLSENPVLDGIKFRPDLESIDLNYSSTCVRIHFDSFVTEARYAKHREDVRVFCKNSNTSVKEYFKTFSDFFEEE